MDKIQVSKPTESKKFIAAMLWNVCWLILIAMGIVRGTGDSVLLSMVWVSGATQITYIGGQAALDAFVRKAFVLGNTSGSAPKKGVGEPQG